MQNHIIESGRPLNGETARTVYTQGFFTGERALYGKTGIRVEDSVFDDGESPLKECRDVELSCCLFRYKYPLWYCEDVKADGCTWFEMARAGVWYTRRLTVTNAAIEAPKNFRRCSDLTLENVTFHNAEETLWHCDGVRLKNVTAARGPYFAMNSRNLDVDGLTLDGNYSFDGAENAVIRNSRLLTKDAFWNSRNVTVIDSFISGEYLGWNSENLTLINCTVESLQGMCYIKNLKMIGCKLIHTNLAFEYSEVDAELSGKADSVFNPKSGRISIPRIDELILESDKVDPSGTDIECPDVGKRSDRPEWLR
ncbi:MAG: DUF3737 family protein [Clostridia bacterium]|nr:DUF3737 family protein [Clostridia bacterium]